jgi:hypothetical protein
MSENKPLNSILALISAIKKYYLFIALGLLICFGLSYYFSKKLFFYTSWAGVMVNHQFAGVKLQQVIGDGTELASNESFVNIVKSSQVFDHLISTLHLYNYYGLNPGDPFLYEKTHALLSHVITVTGGQNGYFIITATDRNEYMCCKLVVQTIYFLDSLQRYTIRQGLLENIKFLKSMNTVSERQTKFETAVTNYIERSTSYSNDKNYQEVVKLYNEVKDINDRNNNSLVSNNYILEKLAQEKYSPILILQKPMYDFHSPYQFRIHFGFMFTLMMMVIAIVLFFVIHPNLEESKMLWNAVIERKRKTA